MKNMVRVIAIFFWGNCILSSSTKIKEIENRLDAIISKVADIDQDVQKLFNFLNEFMPNFTKLGNFCIQIETLYNNQSRCIENFKKEVDAKIDTFHKQLNIINNLNILNNDNSTKNKGSTNEKHF